MKANRKGQIFIKSASSETDDVAESRVTSQGLYAAAGKPQVGGGGSDGHTVNSERQTDRQEA